MMREWLDWMKPMPPMSAARLKTHFAPSHALTQLSMSLPINRYQGTLGRRAERAPEVQQQELVTEGIILHELVLLPVDATNKVTFGLELLGEV